MADEQQVTSANQKSTAEIVSAYVSRNQLAADQLPALISAVHDAISRLGTPVEEPAGERTPAVPIRRSVHRDYVVCLDCGWKGQMLRRHLSAAHIGETTRTWPAWQDDGNVPSGSTTQSDVVLLLMGRI